MARFIVGSPLGISKANAIPYMVFNTQTTTGLGNAGGGALGSVYAPTIPANTLDVNGDSLIIECVVYFINNANNKRYSIVLGSTTLFDTGSSAFNNELSTLRLMVTRVSVSTQVVSYRHIHGTTVLTGASAALAETLSGALTLDFRSAGVSANDTLLYEAMGWKIGNAV